MHTHTHTHLQVTLQLPLLSQCSAHCSCLHTFLPRSSPSLSFSLLLFLPFSFTLFLPPSFSLSLFLSRLACRHSTRCWLVWCFWCLLLFCCAVVVQLLLFCRAAVCSLRLLVLVVLPLQPHRPSTHSSSCLTFVSDASCDSSGSATPPPFPALPPPPPKPRPLSVLTMGPGVIAVTM